MASAFSRFAGSVAEKVGKPAAFYLAIGTVVLWGLTGPLFHFSDTWQLVINTSTTIITFLMVFVIQHTQNRDSRAIHLKLDELIRVQSRARNVFAGIEDASEGELAAFQAEFRALRAQCVDGTAAAEEASRRVFNKRKPHPSGLGDAGDRKK